jgi:hypothetical protein
MTPFDLHFMFGYFLPVLAFTYLFAYRLSTTAYNPRTTIDATIARHAIAAVGADYILRFII